MSKLNCLEIQTKSCDYTNKLLDKLLFLNQDALVKVNIKEIEKAIWCAKKYHANQKRHSGEPYYSHPIEVAGVTAEYIFDTETIIAALLHDVVEDTDSHLSQIELIFGTKVAEIVNALTKISFNLLLSKEETFNKINLFQDSQKKAITIKVIDRLHNIRTINYIKSVEKQKRIAKETMQFYIPLAKYANLHLIAQELQDSVIKILNL